MCSPRCSGLSQTSTSMSSPASANRHRDLILCPLAGASELDLPTLLSESEASSNAQVCTNVGCTGTFSLTPSTKRSTATLPRTSRASDRNDDRLAKIQIPHANDVDLGDLIELVIAQMLSQDVQQLILRRVQTEVGQLSLLMPRKAQSTNAHTCLIDVRCCKMNAKFRPPIMTSSAQNLR